MSSTMQHPSRTETLSSKKNETTTLAGPIDAPHDRTYQVRGSEPLSEHQHMDESTGPSFVHVVESHSTHPDEGLETTVPVERFDREFYHSVKPGTGMGQMYATTGAPASYSAMYKASPEQFKRKAPVEVIKPAETLSLQKTTETKEETTAPKLSRKEKKEKHRKEKLEAKKEKLEAKKEKQREEAAKKEKLQKEKKEKEKQHKEKQHKEKKIKTKTHKVKAPAAAHEHPVADAIKEETKNALKEAILTGAKVAMGAVARGGIRIIVSSFSSPTEERVVEKVEMIKTKEGTTEEHVISREHPAPIEHILARGARGVHKYSSRFGHNLARQMRKVQILVERDDGRRIDLIREMSMRIFIIEGRIQSTTPEDLTSIEDIANAVHEMSNLVAAKASIVRNKLVAQEEKILERERIARETGDDVIGLAKDKLLSTVGLKKSAASTTTTSGTSSTAKMEDHLAQMRGLEELEGTA